MTTRRPPLVADPFHIPAQRTFEVHAADPPSPDLVALHRAFTAAVRDGASSHDLVALVDRHFVDCGLPSALDGET